MGQRWRPFLLFVLLFSACDEAQVFLALVGLPLEILGLKVFFEEKSTESGGERLLI